MNLDASDRNRRALMVGVLALSGIVAARLTIVPYVTSVQGIRVDMREQRRILNAERELLRNTHALPRKVESALLRDDAAMAALLPGNTPGSVYALLAEQIDSLAESTSVKLLRLEPLAPKQAFSGIQSFPMRVEGESDLEGTLELLLKLEQRSATLRIQDLALELAGHSARDRSPESAEVLGFRFTALGYALVSSKLAVNK